MNSSAKPQKTYIRVFQPAPPSVKLHSTFYFHVISSFYQSFSPVNTNTNDSFPTVNHFLSKCPLLPYAADVIYESLMLLPRNTTSHDMPVALSRLSCIIIFQSLELCPLLFLLKFILHFGLELLRHPPVPYLKG